MAAAAAPPAANPSPGAGSPAAAATTPAAGQARLRLSFTAESWVEVKDGRGEVLLRALNPGGSEKQLDGQPPFAVVVGNVAGTTLTYNGAPVSLVSPKRDNVSRLTVPAQ